MHYRQCLLVLRIPQPELRPSLRFLPLSRFLPSTFPPTYFDVHCKMSANGTASSSSKMRTATVTRKTACVDFRPTSVHMTARAHAPEEEWGIPDSERRLTTACPSCLACCSSRRVYWYLGRDDTRETDISVTLTLDVTAQSPQKISVKSGIGFLDHVRRAHPLPFPSQACCGSAECPPAELTLSIVHGQLHADAHSASETRR